MYIYVYIYIYILPFDPRIYMHGVRSKENMVNTSVAQLKDGLPTQGNEHGSFMIMFRAEASLRSASEPDQQGKKKNIVFADLFELLKASVKRFSLQRNAFLLSVTLFWVQRASFFSSV